MSREIKLTINDEVHESLLRLRDAVGAEDVTDVTCRALALCEFVEGKVADGRSIVVKNGNQDESTVEFF